MRGDWLIEVSSNTHRGSECGWEVVDWCMIVEGSLSEESTTIKYSGKWWREVVDGLPERLRWTSQ